jgi:DNA-binding transcriptional regulator YhcF (GntR family)
VIDEEEIKDPDPQEVREHANQELTQYVKTSVRYALRQGLTETDIRRVCEQVLNEPRS